MTDPIFWLAAGVALAVAVCELSRVSADWKRAKATVELADKLRRKL